jgi:hypothetical protein
MTTNDTTQDHPIFAFLDGSAAFEGVWFGDKHPTRKGAFWWRSVLREALAARQSQPAASLREQEDAAGLEEAAKTLAACFDYPWEHMPEPGRQKMREYAAEVIDAQRLGREKGEAS